MTMDSVCFNIYTYRDTCPVSSYVQYNPVAQTCRTFISCSDTPVAILPPTLFIVDVTNLKYCITAEIHPTTGLHSAEEPIEELSL